MRILHRRPTRSEPSGGLSGDLANRRAALLSSAVSCQPAGSAEASAALADARALLNSLAQQGYRSKQVQQLLAALPPG